MVARDPFRDEAGEPRVLRGVTLATNTPRLAELAGMIGFETVWLEVEHGTASFSEIESLSMAAKAGGCIPTVRIPDHHRHHVLRSVELGGQIIVVPMVNDAETARELVDHGKFPPLGHRGFNMRSRGLRYGLEPPVVSFAEANEFTHLFAQIETVEAVENLEAICRVDGLSGIFIGPGDLSASLGKPGAFTDPDLLDVVARCTRQARAQGKNAGILAMPGPLLDAALGAGANLVFAGNDITNLSNAWRQLLASLPERG